MHMHMYKNKGKNLCRREGKQGEEELLKVFYFRNKLKYHY